MAVIIGSVLVALGIAYCIIGAFFYCKTQKSVKKLFQALKDRLPTTQNIQDILDAIGKIVENFAKLTSPVQMSLLGTTHIAIGVYLLIQNPF